MEREVSGTSNDETASLRHYTLVKQEVTEAVRAMNQFFQKRSVREAAERCQELLVQLAEDRFNLAVVGQFKRGKSTLMNAILGRDLLPTGLLPLTSAITTLCYGPTEHVFLRRKGWRLEQEVPLAQLSAYITERGNPGNEKELIEARVELPVPFLRRGLHFIDTPGIGSARRENTATTYAFLPQMAAVIFVTSVEAPLSEAEEHFLIDIRGQVRQLFVVVNKVDMLDDTNREDVFSYIQTHVKQLLGTGVAHFYPLSARDGLTAKLRHDDNAIHRSGLVAFEQAIAAFLAEAQGRTFLVSVLDRALHIVASSDIEIEPHGSGLRLRQALESLRAPLLTGEPLSAARSEVSLGADESHIIDQVIAEARSPIRKTSEQKKVRMRNCPICVAQGQALFAFFAQWQYTLATDAAAQRAFAIERGLCSVHTWQYQEMASPQGISEGYALLIEMLATELSRLIERGGDHATSALAALLAGPATCAACRLLQEITAEQVEQIVTHLTTTEGREDYTLSTGLCLPHLQAAFLHIEQSARRTIERRVVARFLLREQVRRLDDLADDLRSYTLKRDALRGGLLNQEEAVAWRRALVQLVGERAVRGGAMTTDQNTV